MTTKDVRERCRIDLNVKSEGAYDLFVNEELDEFISFGIRQFYARRLTGFTPDRTSFEQGQKRSDDLRPVYEKTTLSRDESGSKGDVRWVSYKIPSNYQHMLSEDIDVIDDVSVIGTFDVFECTTDNLTARINDSLGDHIYSKGRIRPLRLYTFKIKDIELGANSDIDMYTVLYFKAPDKYDLGDYIIEYIKKPEGFGVYSTGYDKATFNENAQINIIPDHAWDEVIAIAVKHALENSSSYRIQSYSAEKMEVQ